MKDYLNLSITEIHEALVAKEISCVELTQMSLDRIKERNDEIFAFLSTDEQGALEQAKKVDEKIAAGENLGLLEGIPCGIKDNILIKGGVTTAATKILENYVAPYDAHVIEKLKSENAVFVGKTNMDELAMGSSTENSAFGPTKNPHDTTRVPGGTSGGSAAAVADGQVPYAIGSDTGGSIRQPAALCGVVGLKPTYGRVSRYGVMAMTSSFDQIGPIARNVKDAAIVFDAIYGKDNRDATSVDVQPSESFSNVQDNLSGVTLGYVPEMLFDGMNQEVKRAFFDAIEKLENAGATIKKVSLPNLSYSLAAYYLVVPAEISSNVARLDGIRYGSLQEKDNLEDQYKATRGAGFGPEVKRRIMLGTYVLSSGYYDAYYKKAQQVRKQLILDFKEMFKEVDCLLTPTTPTTAFKIGELKDDPLTMYLEDIYTVTANVVGIPGISVPCGKDSNNLPIGLQILGKHFDEKKILDVAYSFEKLFNK